MEKNLRVVVTGASRRLGLFLCEHFCANDCKVFAITRDASTALQALEKNKGLEIVQVDSYEVAPIDAAIEKIIQQADRLDLIVHNVSAFSKDETTFSETPFDLFYRLHMALPAQLNMGLKDTLYNVEKPGNIIHITDIFAENPSAEHVLYCSTKAGLENMAKGFAKKYAPGIRVNAIQPGPIKFLPSHSEAVKEKVLAETLLGREGGFLPIFQAICSIVENAYITGASIKVDGGRALGSR